MASFSVPRFIADQIGDRKALRDGQVKAVAQTLWEKYPGHPWFIDMPDDGSVVKIQLKGLMGPTNWYVLHTTSLKGESGRRRVIQAGGELLERFGMPRLGFSLDEFERAKAAMPLHLRFHGIVPG